MIRTTEAIALNKLIEEIEKGWKPKKFRDVSCSCHINPPCNKCCILAEDHIDEYCEEKGIQIVSDEEFRLILQKLNSRNNICYPTT